MPAAQQICQRCRFQNRVAAQFCASCGTDLSMVQMATAADGDVDQSAENTIQKRRKRGTSVGWLLMLAFGLAVVGSIWYGLAEKAEPVIPLPKMVEIENGPAHRHQHSIQSGSSIENDRAANSWIRRIAQGQKDPYTVQQALTSMLDAANQKHADANDGKRFEVRYEVSEDCKHALQDALKAIDSDLTFFYRDNRFTVSASANVHGAIRKVVSLLNGFTIMKRVDAHQD